MPASLSDRQEIEVQTLRALSKFTHLENEIVYKSDCLTHNTKCFSLFAVQWIWIIINTNMSEIEKMQPSLNISEILDS